MVPPERTSNCSLLLIYQPRKDERLSWLSWLTSSGRFTHITGHPSDAGRAQDRESSPSKDHRSTTVPRHQHTNRVEWAVHTALAFIGATVVTVDNSITSQWHVNTCVVGTFELGLATVTYTHTHAPTAQLAASQIYLLCLRFSQATYCRSKHCYNVISRSTVGITAALYGNSTKIYPWNISIHYEYVS